jgi:hypothetical protein
MSANDDDPHSLRNFPKLLKGAIVALDSTSRTIVNTIRFQYNPETLTRTLEAQVIGKEGGARREVLRFKGAPKEMINLDIEIDSTGPLSSTEQDSALRLGIYPQLSALETLIYPTSDYIQATMAQAERGVLEILPMEAPMTLLVWGIKRVLPVQLTSFRILEEAYDVKLNPIRAKVTLGMRVLNYDDFPRRKHLGTDLFLAHHKAKEQLATERDLGYSAAQTGVQEQQFLRPI